MPFVILGGWSDPYAIYYFQWSFPLLDHVAHDAADRCAVHANETEPRPPVTTPGSVASGSGETPALRRGGRAGRASAGMHILLYK